MLSALPSLFLLLFYRTTPESPRYLCLKGRTADAVNILQKIAKMNGTKLPPGNIVTDHQIELHKVSDPSEDTRLLPPKKTEDEPSKEIDSNLGGISSLSMLLSPKMARSTILLWIVFFGNAFSYYGLVLLTSELNNRRSKCMPHSLQSEKSHDVSYKDVFIASFAGINYFIYLF